MDTEPPSCVYDAAIVMAKFIEKNHSMSGKTAVELGSGCGFTACHIARLANDSPPKVICTDLDSVMPLIERNVAANGLTDKIMARPLFWGNQEHLAGVISEAGDQSIDMVYGADILFDFDNFEGLFDIFDKLHRRFVPREG